MLRVRRNTRLLYYPPSVELLEACQRRRQTGMLACSLTIPMNDTGWLRKSLHTKDSPQVDLRVGVLAIRWVATQHQQVVAQDANQGPGGQLRRQALDLDRGGVPLRINDLEGHRRAH